MEVRCTGCNKLFRVSDDKITGSGVKFSCTRCGDTVKITREDFEQHNLSQDAVAALSSFEPKPKTAPLTGQGKGASMPEAADDSSVFDLSDPAAAAASLQNHEEIPDIFAQPAPSFEAEAASEPEPSPFDLEPQKQPAPPQKIESKQAPLIEPKTEVKAAVQPKPEPIRPNAQPVAAQPAREIVRQPAPIVVDAASPETPAPSSGSGKKAAVLIIALLLTTAAGFGVKFYLERPSQSAPAAVKPLTLPDGLQVQSAAGAIDPDKGDLIITGVVENTTDTPKPAWYIVVDVYDAQGTVLTRGKLLSGKQVYTGRDFALLMKRGVNIQEFMMKNLQEQGTIIPPKSSVNFELSIIDPPIGVASFNATLQPFDPVQLFKEMAEEQKQ